MRDIRHSFYFIVEETDLEGLFGAKLLPSKQTEQELMAPEKALG